MPISSIDIANDEAASNNMRQQLQNKFADIQSRRNNFESVRVKNEDAFMDSKNKILRDFFKTMMRYGIDVQDTDSISAFLEKVRQNDRDLADLFEEILNNLLGAESDVSEDDVPKPVLDPSGQSTYPT